MQEIEKIRFVAGEIVTRKRVGALTGAGISVESGIPDFRSSKGLWERFDPLEYATIEAFKQDPHKVWKMLREMEEVVRRAKPNPAHRALARMEEIGLLLGLITQNIDNLHQEAGSRAVIEFHGNGRRLVCLNCGISLDSEGMSTQGHCDDRYPPLCPSCLSILKPDVVFFGEPIPKEATRRSLELVQSINVFLVIGTSAMVAPASYLPMLAKRNGAFLVEINVEHTQLTDELADVILKGLAGDVIPALVLEIEKILS